MSYVNDTVYDEIINLFGTKLYFFGDTHADDRERRALAEICERENPEVIFVEAEDHLWPKMNKTHGALVDYLESDRCDVIGIDHEPKQDIVELTGIKDTSREFEDDVDIHTSDEKIAQKRADITDAQTFRKLVEEREEDMVTNILQGVRERQPHVAVVSVGENHIPSLVNALEFLEDT